MVGLVRVKIVSKGTGDDLVGEENLARLVGEMYHFLKKAYIN